MSKASGLSTTALSSTALSSTALSSTVLPPMIKTTCPYCGVGCGVDATVKNEKIIAVSGDKHHPANLGRLCVKGSSLHETNHDAQRLLHPRVDGQEVSWEKATAHVASSLSSLIAQHGPDSVALYVSGQLLTEDYYVANKLMKGFIGSANIDTNSRLCMSSAVASYTRAFGEDLVPCDYSDLDHCDLLVLVGSNAAWTHPILYQRMEAAKTLNPQLKVVIIDPRRTATAAIADLHLQIAPGSDAALFMGLAHFLIKEEKFNEAFLTESCTGFEAFVSQVQATADQWIPSVLGNTCGVDEALLLQFFSLFAATEKVVTFYSQGINQSSTAVDKSTSIINCHLLTGRIGKAGSGPFSVTGQPNAMGGREVGGLANQLAAHMRLDNPIHRERVQRFWKSPVMANRPGYKALELFERIHSGDVKAVWIIATNPLVSLPNHEFVKQALSRCELVIVSDMTDNTDTAAFADVLLPATSWGEKEGTVTNSERQISRQRALIGAPGEARHDWEIICDVAVKMGFRDGFNYRHPAEIFREHAALSGFENPRERFFDISALQDISDEEYNAFSPRQWPCPANAKSSPARLFGDGIFPTPDGRARLIVVEPKPPQQSLSAERPFRLNSGRIRDQWHTMTRTGLAARLHKHIDEPFVEVHPRDLQDLGGRSGDLLQLDSDFGSAILRCKAHSGQMPGQLFVPIHWSRSFASRANVGALFAWVADPISGQPETKHGSVAAQCLKPEWQGTLCSATELNREWLDSVCLFWSKALIAGGYRYQLAGNGDPMLWYQHWGQLFHDGETLAVDSQNCGDLKIAQFSNNMLQSLGLFGKHHRPCTMVLFSDLRARAVLAPGDWNSAITTAAHLEAEKDGAQVCSCFNIGENLIRGAIESGDNSVEALGKRLRCGTNCGSCIPELRDLIRDLAADDTVFS